jgi:MRG-binding protein
MIALSEHLRNHGYDPKVHAHTRIPGIWKKLGTLYNLAVIDERENSFDYAEEDSMEKKYLDFTLPEEDFGNMMWVRGMAPSNAGSSPSRLQEASEPMEPSKRRKRGETVNTSRARASTIEDTDEAKTSPAPSPATKPGRAPRSGKRSSSRLKADPSDRQASKDTTADEVDDNEDGKADAMDIADEEHEEEGDGEDGEEGTPSPRASRSAAKGAKGGTQARAQSSTRKSTRRK